MSFLGSIGHIMHEPGLKEVLELIYSENAVTHMLTGKAYARAVRGHVLLDAALNAVVMARSYDVNLLPPVRAVDIEKALECLDDLLAEEITQNELKANELLDVIHDKLQTEKAGIVSKNATGQLWVQYMHLVELRNQFIQAQRTGNFMLYLKSMQDMLPYLSASGHNNYVKSITIHLQDMLELEENTPHLFQLFNSGLFVVRRSDRFWAGLPSDFVIEQVLMRTVKTTGGLTRGRGLEENQRTRWLLSTPACAQVNEAIQELTGAQYNTSDQHKDLTKARKERDHMDRLNILEYFQDYNPFAPSELHSIATGFTATGACNQHLADEVGRAILTKMEDHNAYEYTFQRKDQINRMGLKSIDVDGVKVTVDPQVIFQRFLIVANNTSCEPDELLKHELSTYPTALFDKHGFLREADKPQLADTLRTVLNTANPPVPAAPKYNVFDGGSLLHRFKWRKCATFDELAQVYVGYVKRFSNPVVVFDGYETSSSTKHGTHMRRSKGVIGPKVLFTGTMTMKATKEQFLGNTDNTQNFITFLSEKLEANGLESSMRMVTRI